MLSLILVTISYSQEKRSSFLFHENNLLRNNHDISNQILPVIPDITFSRKHSILNLSGQLLVGSTLAMGFSIIPAGLVGAASFGKETEVSVPLLNIIAVSSCLFGSAVGVHWVAKAENSNLAFWKTVGYSAIGGSGGVLILTLLTTQYVTVPAAGIVVVALCPIIGSMIYSSFISDWPQENSNAAFYKNNFSHKDLIERSKLFNFEIMRIKL